MQTYRTGIHGQWPKYLLPVNHFAVATTQPVTTKSGDGTSGDCLENLCLLYQHSALQAWQAGAWARYRLPATYT